MQLRVVTAVLCCALSGAAAGQQSPSAVTDVQIREYKAAAEADCVDSGKSRGDPPDKVAAFCKCMTGVFEKNLTREDWQKVFYYSTQKRAAEEANVFGPHLNKTRACARPN